MTPSLAQRTSALKVQQQNSRVGASLVSEAQTRQRVISASVEVFDSPAASVCETRSIRVGALTLDPQSVDARRICTSNAQLHGYPINAGSGNRHFQNSKLIPAWRNWRRTAVDADVAGSNPAVGLSFDSLGSLA